jgi:hypothetical protein
MVGGTIRRKLIHRESFRASVLHPTLATTRCQNHCTGILRLDIAFVLIDGTRTFRVDLNAIPPAQTISSALSNSSDMIRW